MPSRDQQRLGGDARATRIPGGNNARPTRRRTVTGQFALFAEKTASPDRSGDRRRRRLRRAGPERGHEPSARRSRWTIGCRSDLLPHRARPGSDGAAVPDPAGSPGPVLSLRSGTLPAGTTLDRHLPSPDRRGRPHRPDANVALAGASVRVGGSNVAVAAVRSATAASSTTVAPSSARCYRGGRQAGGSRWVFPGVRI